MGCGNTQMSMQRRVNLQLPLHTSMAPCTARAVVLLVALLMGCIMPGMQRSIGGAYGAEEPFVLVHLVFGAPIGEVTQRAAYIAQNLSDALYQASALERYSILNRSNNFFPSPPPIALVEIASISIVPTDDQLVAGVLTDMSMVSIRLTSNRTAKLLMYLANTDMGNGTLAGVLNPVRRLGVRGAQYEQPSIVDVDDTISLTITVGLAALVFVAFLLVSVVSSRRRMIQESRGINFNDLIRLEMELYEDADRRLMLL